jgi:Arc/MetJ-type ribon-helix-helix transcriptional regulator
MKKEAAPMTIQITKPEVEALINQRLQSGAFKDAEDVIMQALKASREIEEAPAQSGAHTAADLIAAMRASPYKEIDLEPVRKPMPVRGVTL